MAGKEFNLSILENVTAFSTPLKECSDYEAILSLIKEEIDIAQTEDEMEYQKSSKKSPRIVKRKDAEFRSSEAIFKSPYKKKYPTKLLSPGAQTVVVRKNSVGAAVNFRRENRAQSLGRVKPGRSFSAAQRRRSLNSHSESSNFSHSEDGLKVETPRKTMLNGYKVEKVERNSLDSEKAITGDEEGGIDSANVDNANSVSCKGESTSLTSTDLPDVGADDESFVESSQTLSKSSELRIKLNHRRSASEVVPTKTEPIGENTSKTSANDEDENENFSLVLSPLRQKRRKISGSPLNGLSQELENCIRNGDYVEMCDSETESMSFTFETIQLLNEYEDGNQQANNKIFDKILASPAKQPKIEPLPIIDNVSEIEQPTEDPLHIEDANADASTATSERKAKKKKTPQRKSLRTPKVDEEATSDVQTHEDHPHTAENDTRKKSPASTSKRKGNATPKAIKDKSEKTTPREKKSSNDAQTDHDEMSVKDIHTDENDVLKSSKKESSSRKTVTGSSEELTDSTTFRKINKRRSSIRLASKTPEPNKFDSDSDDDLAMKAAELAKNVAVARKKDALSDEVLEKLNNLVVRLRHEVLPQHEIENRAGSAALSYEQQKQFLSYAPLNKGKYSPAEDEIIKENWNDFCEDHDWDPEDYKPFILLKHGKQLIMSSLAERRKFVQFLANGLPYRPLCSVYSRFRLIYNKYEAMGLKYTPEEDAKIIAYMKCVSVDSQDHRCAELAKVMNRSRISIWKRYKKLISNEHPVYQTKRVLTRVEWDLPLIEEFIATLLRVSLTDELIDLKGAFFPRGVWVKMEKKLKINWDIMRRFWEHKLHLQLFVPEPIFMNAIRIRLIKYMYKNKIRSCKEINWNNVLDYFDGYTKAFLRYVFNTLTMQTAEALKTRDFSEIMEWLYTRRVAELQYKMWDKHLPRISYKDNKAELVVEDLARMRIKTEGSHVD